ncbi:MAG: hypothetical protein JNJ50_27080 [Acidobacteria bacterium]|nr:hypothetical protein [Acidobacteriota bacterium]
MASQPANVLSSSAFALLDQEAHALLTRLDKVKPFALHETMVPAAALPPAVLSTIDRYLIIGRRKVYQMVRSFLHWLHSPARQSVTAETAYRRFTTLRLRFNAALSQFDIFADALTQRSEQETGVWLAGLDVMAADALFLPGDYYQMPGVICYLDRGHGAAIRRARTRLPGGGENPVAIIRVPRERMVGSGIASSLIHEVGHQAAALLDLVESIRPVLRELQRNGGEEQPAWAYWDRCISEILADFWSVARVGMTSTLGLIGVVALPRYFVFRLNLDDPHPVPWMRVRLSIAIGRALFPHPQWDQLESTWLSYYPPEELDEQKRRMLALLEKTMPVLANLLANHQPRALRGLSLKEALQVDQRQPTQLAGLFQAWRASPRQMHRASPSLVFAVIGQARIEARISPQEESQILSRMLTYWALRDTLDPSIHCARPAQIQSSATPSRLAAYSRR